MLVLVSHIGARAGNRTLNLGIKSLSTRRLREDQGGSERLIRTRIYDATVSESLQESQGVSRSRCQLGCENPALIVGRTAAAELALLVLRNDFNRDVHLLCDRSPDISRFFGCGDGYNQGVTRAEGAVV